MSEHKKGRPTDLPQSQNDLAVDNVVTAKVADLWRAYGAAGVQTYQFPADLHLSHGLIDVQEPEPNVAVVCSKLLELIDRLTAL